MHRTRTGRYRSIFIAVAAFALATAVVFYPAASRPGRFINGSLDDAYAIIWQLWWFKFSLADLHALPFFTQFVESPFGVPLTQMTIINHILALPITILGGPVASYNIMILLSFFLAAAGAYLLVRELTGDDRAAFIAGAAYSFSPFHTVFSASGGMDAAQVQYLPFVLFFVMRHARTARARDAVLAFVFFALTVFSFGYYAALAAAAIVVYLVYTYLTPLLNNRAPGHGAAHASGGRLPLPPGSTVVYATAGYILWVLAFNLAEEVDLTLKLFTSVAAPAAMLVFLASIRVGRVGGTGSDGEAPVFGQLIIERVRSLDARHRTWMMAGAVAFVAAVYVILVPVFTAAARPISSSYIVPAFSYIFPAPDHPLLGRYLPDSLIPLADPLSGKMVYTGLTIPILAVVGMLASKRPAAHLLRAHNGSAWTLEARRKGYFTVLLAASVLLLLPPVIRIGDFNLYGPIYFFHRIVPPFVDIRRVILLVLLAATVLAGYGMAAISERIRPGALRWLLYASVLALIAVEFMPATSYRDMSVVPGAYSWLAAEDGEMTVVEYPLTSIYDSRRYEAFYGQTIHKKRLVNPFAAVGHDPRPANTALRVLLDRGGAANDPLSVPENAASALARIGVDYAVFRTDKTGALPEELPGFTEVAAFDGSAVYRVEGPGARAVVSFDGFVANGHFENYSTRVGDEFIIQNPYVRVPLLWTGGTGQKETAWLGLSGDAAMRIVPLDRRPGLYDLSFRARAMTGGLTITVSTQIDDTTRTLTINESPAEYTIRDLYVNPVDGPLTVTFGLPADAPGREMAVRGGAAGKTMLLKAAVTGVVVRESATDDDSSALRLQESVVRAMDLDGMYMGAGGGI